MEAKEFYCDWMNMDRADMLETDMYFIKCMEAFSVSEWQKGYDEGRSVQKMEDERT